MNNDLLDALLADADYHAWLKARAASYEVESAAPADNEDAHYWLKQIGQEQRAYYVRPALLSEVWYEENVNE